MIGYGFRGKNAAQLGGVDQRLMDNDYISMGADGEKFPGLDGAGEGGTFIPNQFTYDFKDASGGALGATEFPGNNLNGSNVFVVDFTQGAGSNLYPRHVGEVYSNLLAVINIASQDIYRTTMRGPGSWLLTSPLMAALMESAAKLEGGIAPSDGPTNVGKNSIEYKGKFLGRYDLYVDVIVAQDEILMGYKGQNAMDAGYVYAPYIPLQQLPTVVDPETFQPRKGLLTRYGKVQIEPNNRFYRIIRVVGATSNFLMAPFARNNTVFGADVPS